MQAETLGILYLKAVTFRWSRAYEARRSAGRTLGDGVSSQRHVISRHPTSTQSVALGSHDLADERVQESGRLEGGVRDPRVLGGWVDIRECRHLFAKLGHVLGPRR